jgi:hypothetical protein
MMTSDIADSEESSSSTFDIEVYPATVSSGMPILFFMVYSWYKSGKYLQVIHIPGIYLVYDTFLFLKNVIFYPVECMHAFNEYFRIIDLDTVNHWMGIHFSNVVWC